MERREDYTREITSLGEQLTAMRELFDERFDALMRMIGELREDNRRIADYMSSKHKETEDRLRYLERITATHGVWIKILSTIIFALLTYVVYNILINPIKP